jgi:probable rRNA maturation factor
LLLHVDLVCDPGVAYAPADALQALVAYASERIASAPWGDWSIVVRLTTDDEIGRLHARFFNDPSPTDVIAFPSGEAFDAAAGTLGDVVISVERARAQAVDVNHSTEREVAFLALHGMLHLCGHDDITAAEREQMLALQEQWLAQFEARQDRPPW